MTRDNEAGQIMILTKEATVLCIRHKERGRQLSMMIHSTSHKSHDLEDSSHHRQCKLLLF
jgi:hypothetical protein